MNARPLYLNGEWRRTARSIEVRNPATGEAFDAVCTVGRPEVARAVADAHLAFAGWRDLSGRERGEFLDRAADVMEAKAEEISRGITLENGKPLAQSRGEVAMSVDHLRWFAEEAKRAYGRTIPRQVGGKRHATIKTPIGVVGAISPWNFPLVLAVRKVAPALAAGCPVILKPASATPVSAVRLAECFDTARLPAGIFQLVLGPAGEIAAEFLQNPECRKITFTGSTTVGQSLIRGAAEQVKALSLELGGHAPAIVFDDADADRAVEGVIVAKFRNSGQSCIAANRIFVQSGIYDRFVERFVARASQLKMADGLVDGADVGPLIDRAGLDKAIEHIQDAVQRGAKVLCGGKRRGATGWFLEPTVLGDVTDDALCMREETFAPVAPLCRFATEADGLRRANASPYGLAAYMFTQNLDRSFRVTEQLEAGTIGVNDGAPTTSQCPFGGMKQSGWGRELGIEGLDAFLETKHLSFGIR